MTNFFFERYRPEICRGLHKWCCEQILRHLRLFRAKKKIFKNLKFFDFFAYPGSQISWKMTNVFFARYRPEICRGLHKWCWERILRRFGSFRAKKIFFEGSQFFDFFCISGVTDFLKNDQLLFWEIRAWKFRGLHKWCCERILRCFRSFRAKKNFPRLQIFWLFLHIRGHRFFAKGLTTFLRNTGLKFVVDCTNGVANEF